MFDTVCHLLGKYVIYKFISHYHVTSTYLQSHQSLSRDQHLSRAVVFHKYRLLILAAFLTRHDFVLMFAHQMSLEHVGIAKFRVTMPTRVRHFVIMYARMTTQIALITKTSVTDITGESLRARMNHQMFLETLYAIERLAALLTRVLLRVDARRQM